MPEIESYSWDDVDRLGNKINELDLEPAERALMAAMLGLANDVIARRGAEEGVQVTPGDEGTIEYDAGPELGSQVSYAMDPLADPSPVAHFRIIPHNRLS